MDLKKVTLKTEDAEAEYKKYLEVVKTRKEKQYEDLKKVYRALSKGYKVIDIFKAFEDTGSENNHPRIALARADSREVFFRKEVGGGGRFTVGDTNDWQFRETAADVVIPGGLLPEWELVDPARGRGNFNIKDRNITTKVPVIPGHLLPEGKLENYYILFEADEWNPIAATDDPYLLKRINANTFIVLAEWDVSDVEKIVMRGV